jgi:glycosyltransferase involved in cell wall biosynthesis
VLGELSMTAHVLDVGSVWVKEFGSALSGLTDTLGWQPNMSWVGLFISKEFTERLSDPPLTIQHFALQRGYTRFPFSALVNLGSRQVKRLRRACKRAADSPLICTTPFYAPVAERWPGPVVYYQTDLTIAYAGIDPKSVRSHDERLCRVAAAVCPNSKRVGEYMIQDAGCDPAKIVVVPNATRAENVLSSIPSGPGPLPLDLQDLPRPVIGVIGNLAANLDWQFLSRAVKQTPDYSWAFVGPTNMPVYDSDQSIARERLLQTRGRVRFTGAKPYALLQQYARCLDAAVLPYRRKEPTFSGSSTRFYEHLAACRPIFSTRGFEELLHKQPLLTLVDSPEELVGHLEDLRTKNFTDALEELRWKASHQSTWQVRAATLMCAVQDRWPTDLDIPPIARRMAAGLATDLPSGVAADGHP